MEENPSAPCQPNQLLGSASRELQSASSNEQSLKRNRPQSPQHESHHVSAQSPKRSRIANPLCPPSFPQEVLVEILSNLPVKSLLRFRCVSKSWKALIADPFFIKKHLEKNQNKPTSFSNKRILICTLNMKSPIQYKMKPFFIRSIYEDPIVNKTKIGYPARRPLYDDHDTLVGSCNGLVCIAMSENTVYLLNPTLRVCKKLPYLPMHRRSGSTVFGFGFDASADDYKVVAGFCYQKGHETESIVRVYSLRTNRWRRIQAFPFGAPLFEKGKHVNGSLNWFAYRGPSPTTIFSLDLAQETYKEVMQPCYGNGAKYDRTLGVLDGCLCVLCDYGRGKYADVWIMKEYGKGDSWTKLVTIPYLHRGPQYLGLPLFVSESGEILLRYGLDLILYNPNKNTFRSPVIPALTSSGICGEVVFGESLFSPIAVNQHG